MSIEGTPRAPLAPTASTLPGAASPARVLCAVDDRGLAYAGDLVADVREFRRLLARLSCARSEAGPLLERFEGLAVRLRHPSHPARSRRVDRYRRFFCSVPTLVCTSDAGDVPVVMIDFGPDGAQLCTHGRRLAVDSVLWLLLDVVDESGRAQTLAFPGHVEVSTEDYAELSFTGEPTPLIRELDARPAIPRPPTAAESRPWGPR